MQTIRCAENNSHVMVYREVSGDTAQNGYYCTKCEYKELDTGLSDDMLAYQQKRKVD